MSWGTSCNRPSRPQTSSTNWRRPGASPTTCSGTSPPRPGLIREKWGQSPLSNGGLSHARTISLKMDSDPTFPLRCARNDRSAEYGYRLHILEDLLVEQPREQVVAGLREVQPVVRIRGRQPVSARLGRRGEEIDTGQVPAGARVGDQHVQLMPPRNVVVESADGWHCHRCHPDAGLGGPLIHRGEVAHDLDRKSTRLNSSHSQISYAVFCLKKKRNQVPPRPHSGERPA